MFKPDIYASHIERHVSQNMLKIKNSAILLSFKFLSNLNHLSNKLKIIALLLVKFENIKLALADLEIFKFM